MTVLDEMIIEQEEIVNQHVDIYKKEDESAKFILNTNYPVDHFEISSRPFINWKYNLDFAIESKKRDALVDVYDRLEKKLRRNKKGETAIVLSEILTGTFKIQAKLSVDVYHVPPMFI